ncbi:unnamed protein product, partial [Closterium sp. NIES-54]
ALPAIPAFLIHLPIPSPFLSSNALPIIAADTVFMCLFPSHVIPYALPPTAVPARAADNQMLKGSLPADISTLTALTYLNLLGNLLSYRLDSFTTNLRALPVLADM